ncbi:MAG: prepilin-type N-terminal cleavage/methylation domain-containing protein [Verrucomicrobiales bacterium]|nr:prepilin-type N-terminal cleavage/methylation domain-containing protein [Verrucomicrobiales bacterium]
MDRNYRQASGFTLLEVVAGLAIVGLLLGGVYGVANGALQLGKQSGDSRKQEVRATNFSKFLRSGFSRLGPEAGIELTAEGLVISGGPVPFPVGPHTATADSAALVFADETVFLAHFNNRIQISEIRLLETVEDLSWECQDPETGTWVSKFQGRPELIRLTINREGAEHFWIPPYQY